MSQNVLYFNTDEERTFWKEVYVAYVKSGRPWTEHDNAIAAADYAIRMFRARSRF